MTIHWNFINLIYKLSTMTDFVPITRYSRCKRYSGAVIKCPECHSLGQIYHLSWSALQCQNCKKMIDKFDWYIEKGKYSKT